jgi:hypothetical protein
VYFSVVIKKDTPTGIFLQAGFRSETRLFLVVEDSIEGNSPHYKKAAKAISSDVVNEGGVESGMSEE